MTYTFVREPLSSEETDLMVNACRAFREKLVIWTRFVNLSRGCSLGVPPTKSTHRTSHVEAGGDRSWPRSVGGGGAVAGCKQAVLTKVT